MPDPGTAADDDGLAIRVHGLRKSYGSNEAVRGIDLEVRTGEVFGFLGANGAGKTTTLEILEGYRSRTAGEVRVLGADPARPTRAWRDRIGLVLQECRLNPSLTLRETLDLYASFYTRPRRADEVIELVGLRERRDSRLGTLSGGQQRRADVAVALIGDPDLIFLDEPTTGFDPGARREAWRMIEGLRALGRTVVLTTHYMDEAQHLSDRVAILRAGRVVASGSPRELADTVGRSTTVSFRLPAGADLDGLPVAREDTHREGEAVTLRTTRPQPLLRALLERADREGLSLAELEVRRPTLEDLFLQLTDGPLPPGRPPGEPGGEPEREPGRPTAQAPADEPEPSSGPGPRTDAGAPRNGPGRPAAEPPRPPGGGHE